MKILEKKCRGQGKADFKKNIAFIKEELATGAKASEIYRELEAQNKITVDISVFRRYVRQLKASIAGQGSSVQSAPVPVSAPPPSKNKNTAVSAPSLQPSHPKPKQPKTFEAKPIDLDAQFEDEDNSPKSKDEVTTLPESEVAHG